MFFTNLESLQLHVSNHKARIEVGDPSSVFKEATENPIEAGKKCDTRTVVRLVRSLDNNIN
jgi:hypothetical protein